VRVFPDTNVLLSAFFGRGLCADLLQQLIESPGHEILMGEPVMREFVRIARAKFRVADADLAYAFEVCARQTRVPKARKPYPGIIATVPDPGDTPILACALAARADCFITGDKALLDFANPSDTSIMSPRQAWQMLRGA
jgi:putative PIN family toxin of toxin-antitoxin system